MQPRLVRPKLGSAQPSTGPPRLCAYASGAAQLPDAAVGVAVELGVGELLADTAPVPEAVPVGEGVLEAEAPEVTDGVLEGVTVSEPVGEGEGVSEPVACSRLPPPTRHTAEGAVAPFTKSSWQALRQAQPAVLKPYTLGAEGVGEARRIGRV